MSGRARFIMLALSLFSIAASPSSGSATEEAGIVLLVPQLLPTWPMDDNQLIGIWVDLSKLAATRAQVTIAGIHIVPYARIFRDVPSGQNHCCPVIARTAGREKDYKWLAPTQRMIVSAFVLKDRANPPRTLGDLKNESVLAIRGILSAETRASLGLSADEVNTGDEAVRMLQRGRASAVVLGNVASWMAERRGVALQEAVRLWEWPGYFACSPILDAAITRRLAEAIKQIFARGEDRAFAAADGLGDQYERMRPVAVDPPPAAEDQ